MMYEIYYTETYGETYYVQADSKEEAEDKLLMAIGEGKVNGPDNCVDSDMEVKEHALVIKRFLDVE